MNPEHLHYLCCPKTGQSFDLIITEIKDGNILSGTLRTIDGKNSYPIIRGIPRFVGDEYYSNSFGYEWNKFPRVQFEEDNFGKPMEGHTSRMFYTITGLTSEEMKGQSYIEFGCGPGRFLDIVRKNGGIAVGIDLSIAVEAAQRNLGEDPQVLIVQGDIFSPPFKQNIFDGGYSIGVLHHTPNPEQGLHSLCSVVKEGGKITVAVYPKKGLYAAYSTLWTRRLMVGIRKLFGEQIGYRLAMSYSFLSAYLFFYISAIIRRIPRIGSKCSYLLSEYGWVVVFVPDSNWRILDTFDAITPEYASTHTAEEVMRWLTKAGCKNLKQSTWGETSWQAEKSKICVE